MTEMPKVSVIVVSFNSEKFITKCLDSILQSNYAPLEILVVDNASNDNTINELKKFQNKLKLIQSKKNLGFAAANNLGIKKSDGEIIVLINPDAFVTKNAIRELILPILNDDKIMITGPKILYPETNKIQSAGGIIQKNGLPNHYGYQEEDNAQYDVQKKVDYVTGAVIALKRKLFELTGLFDPIYFPAYYEETEKCVQARKLNFQVVYVPKSVVYHYESTIYGALSESFLKTFHTSRFKFVYRNYSLKDYFTKFLPSEINWFFKYCPSSEKKIVIKSHLKAIFSKSLKQKNPKL